MSARRSGHNRAIGGGSAGGGAETPQKILSGPCPAECESQIRRSGFGGRPAQRGGGGVLSEGLGRPGLQASAWRGLGEAERRLGSNQQAFEAYQHAVALDPADTGSQYWIGVIGTWLGRTAEADASGFNEVLARRGKILAR